MRPLKISKQITNRENSSLEKYLYEISKVSLISMDEEIELAKRIREGDKLATEKLVKANLRFVVSVAKQYQYSGLPLIDLINEGNLGLIKAAGRFDESRGFKFISYAVWWIRQCIIQAIAKQSRIVRVPLNRVSSYNQITRTYSAFEQKNGREPQPEEIAEILGMEPEEVVETLKKSLKHVSIDAPFSDSESNSLGDLLVNTFEKTPDSTLLGYSLKKDIKRALNFLPKKKARVISLYFGLDGSSPMSLEGIGEEFNITRERVRQIKDQAIKELKELPIKETFKSYMGV
jgi:RNA polymerase primary sigma factor